MRGVLIDPETKSIVEVAYTGGDLHEYVKADCLDFFPVTDHRSTFDQGVVDDFGLTRGPVYAFKFDWRDDPIGGKCLLLGARKGSGETCSVKTPLLFLEEHIEWLGLIAPKVEWEDTETGSRAVVTWEPCND
jgi:hypothetical protein